MARRRTGMRRGERPVGTFDGVRSLMLRFPGVEEGTSYGTPAFRVRGKFLTRLHDREPAIVVGIEDDVERRTRVEVEPETYYITAHYAGTKYVLVRLDSVGEDDLADLLERRWRELASKRQIEDYESRGRSEGSRSES